MKETRTRFAPSPTGMMHIGNLRTALYAYLLARKQKGNFLLRIEDTDQARFVEGALEKILETLRWAGLKNDEGVILEQNGETSEKGERGPYFQSKRLETYKQHADLLLEKGFAYPCFCSKERLDELRKQQQQEKKPPRYDKCCLDVPPEEAKKRIENGEEHVIRLNVPADKIVEFKDAVYGKISVKGETIDDQVLIKSDGFPTYHLAVVVDDHLMGITHVVRGEEWLPSAPKHALLYEYLGWEAPNFVHVPNILGENKRKLSKREGDVSVEAFIQKGYLPEAIINFIALLGWNPKSEQEYFTLGELEEIFDVSGLHKAGAIFDYKKLDWMNSHYIKQRNDDELFELSRPFLKKYCAEKKYIADEQLLKKITKIEKERMKKLAEVVDNIDFYFAQSDYDPDLLRWKDNAVEQTKKSLEEARDVLSGIEEGDFELEKLESALMEAAGEKRGDFLWPLRFALTGEKKSPSPFEVAWALGRKESLKRVSDAISKLA